MAKKLKHYFLFMAIAVGDAMASYSRERCYANVKQTLIDGTLSPNDPVFFRDKSGQPMSDINKFVLTRIGCQEKCGRGAGWYDDIGPRLSVWIVPVFLLLTNIEVSPLDKRRYWMILHLLGDPLDSLWSILTKLEAWSRCYGLAETHPRTRGPQSIRSLATVLGAIEELTGSQTNPVEVYNAIMSRQRSDLAQDDPRYLRHHQINLLVRKAAQRLADSRTDERLRTLLALALYCYQLASAFITKFGGGNTSPPGGRIGAAMAMTFIIPVILLTNAIGGFTSIRTSFNILEDLVKDTTTETDLWLLLQETVPHLKDHKSLYHYYDAMSWSGAIYTYRPDKRIPFGDDTTSRSRHLLCLLALSPVIISSVIAFVVLWNVPPVGLNCRHFLFLGIMSLFLSSAALTQLMSSMGIQGRVHWYMVLMKDTLIAVPIVVLVFLATAGLFNSCWCWSAVYSLRKAARVPMNAKPLFEAYNSKTYPILVVVCLLLQCLAFVAMMWVGWTGWRVMRWSEKRRMKEWHRTR